jgi:hypothetical protein
MIGVVDEIITFLATAGPLKPRCYLFVASLAIGILQTLGNLKTMVNCFMMNIRLGIASPEAEENMASSYNVTLKLNYLHSTRHLGIPYLDN